MVENCRYCEKWKEQCRKFEEHFYWGHVNPRRMHFSKSMTGDFSKSMIIPKKFIEHFNGELLETVELKVPSGDIWHVELKKTNDGVVLDCGWKYFVEAQGIEENDTLVFKYDGCSSFLVLIFEQSGCEKAASHCAKKGDPIDSLCDIPSFKRGKHSSDGNSNKHTNQAQPITVHHKNSRPDGSSEEIHVKQRKNSRRIYSRKKLLVGSRKMKAAKEEERCVIKAIENPSNEVSLDKRCSPNIFIVSRKAGIGDADKNKLHSFAESIQTDKPSFVSIMVPCSIVKRFYMVNFQVRLKASAVEEQKGFIQEFATALPAFFTSIHFSNSRSNIKIHTIPIAFAIEHLPRSSNRAILRVPDKERVWPVHCLVQARSVGFTAGWKDFVHDNSLKIGDICFFELLEVQEDIVMTVYINRV